MEKAVSGLLILVGIIHLLPVTGVFGPDRLSSLYGLTLHEPNIVILMRHRAVLFGLLGLFLVYAAFRPTLQPMAFFAGFVSVISFIGIAWSVGDFNGALKRVVIADVVAVIALAVAGVLYLVVRGKR